VLEVLYHRAKFGGARVSPAAGAAKNVEFFVCLSVRHASVKAALAAYARWRRLLLLLRAFIERKIAHGPQMRLFYVNCILFPLKIVVR